jgi:hypothetical protein
MKTFKQIGLGIALGAAIKTNDRQLTTNDQRLTTND